MTGASPFPPDALEVNGQGRLSDGQRQALRSIAGSARQGGLSIAVMGALLGAVTYFVPGPPQFAVTKALVGVAFVVIAVLLFLRSFLAADALTEDLRGGAVQSVEGAISKVRSGSGRSTTAYYLDVAGTRVRADRSQYDSAPDAGLVRVYYLALSRRAVNLERLVEASPPSFL